jgi:hypothetical protein
MTRLQLLFAVLLLLFAGLARAAGFDINGMALGDAEAAAIKAFPSARCKPLEWKSDAADRRCDDGKIVVAGVQAKITVYLKRDSIQGFDLRFDVKDQDRLAGHFKGRWGKPVSEGRDKIYREGKEAREVYKVAWQQGQDRAVLTSVSTGKRASLSAARGRFEEEIYRLK